MTTLKRKIVTTVDLHGNEGTRKYLDQLRLNRRVAAAAPATACAAHHDHTQAQAQAAAMFSSPLQPAQLPPPPLELVNNAFSVGDDIEVLRCTKGVRRLGGAVRVIAVHEDGIYDARYTIGGGRLYRIPESQFVVPTVLEPRRRDVAPQGLSPASANQLQQQLKVQADSLSTLKGRLATSEYVAASARASMNEHARSAAKANASVASAIAARSALEKENLILRAQNYTLERVSGEFYIESAAAAAAIAQAAADEQIKKHLSVSRKRERDLSKQRDFDCAQRFRSEHDAAKHAQARAIAEKTVEHALAAQHKAESKVAALQIALTAVDTERNRQRKASLARAKRKTNFARTRKRAAAKLQLYMADEAARLEVLIKTRKSNAPRAHNTSKCIIAQLAIRDAGRLASGRVGDVVKAFDAYRGDGESFNLKPASRVTIDRWLWKRQRGSRVSNTIHTTCTASR